MVALKLAVSPYKLLRMFTTTATTTTTKRKHNVSVFNGKIGERMSLIYRDRRRITPYTQLPYKRNKAKLGLTFRTTHNSLSRNSSFSADRDYGSHSSGLGSGMGLESKPGSVDDCYSCNNDQKNKLDHQNQQQPLPSPWMQNQNKQSSKLLTLPTILTLGRVAAVPLLVCTFYVDSWWGRTATTSIFIAAAITDWLDGYIARKMKLGSSFGAFLDPVADKLMVAATLVLLCTKPFESAIFGQVPWLLTVPAIAIIGREITMSAVREWAASQNSKLLEAVAVNNLGKWKTATQMIALTILLATRDSSLSEPGLVASGVTLLYISAGLSVWSLFVYMRKIWKVLLK
ncbi:hypothetical protein HS088_TW09G00678 [Tripterygium wilfordii]|uniref:CDP-diacylglycerol--glycerol-3-phosphate 1-phosphatidyltransferase n=1 Tax=Tripterygium wilfordii TaxID=458696 RepID=A0A7J7D8F6_TRIWF|nr:CDP-diacylglycerol--glycerol-3-phosphate 3-phosphatidyltransferase 2 [Tripterygium wilfordii]KAF5742627.1 hypothetical protein HS088_TW09G00678 [Tripterygium wilfordii]